MKDNKSKKYINIAIIIVAMIALTIYGWQLIMLHFNQTMYSTTGIYESDLFAHIEMALDGWGYSILAIIFRGFALSPNETVFHLLIALFLGACEIATLAVTYMWIARMKVNWKLAVALAMISGLVMPLFVRSIQPYRYIGYQSPSIWHNSTYIVMKLCALVSVIIYLEISRKYYSEMKIGKLVIFAIMLAITTSVKTNFVLIFAPVALIFLGIDKVLGVKWKYILLSAATIIPTIGVILYQRYVLFGEDTGNGIIIDPLYSVYLRAEKPYFTMILSAAFPVLVLLVNIIVVLKDTFRDFKNRQGVLTHREFLIAWTMWFMGFVQFLLLRETGARELDDNFAWGYDFCLFMIFIISLIYFTKNIIEKERILNSKVIKWVYVVVGAALIIYHTYCGVYFFVNLTKGATFFMQ